MSKFKEWKEKALLPFKNLPHLLIGFSEAELNKRGELKQLLYSYDLPLNEEQKSHYRVAYSKELLDCVEVNDVQIDTVNGEEIAKIEVGMTVHISDDKYRPLKQVTYPIWLALGYILFLLATTLLVTIQFELNMNFLIYVFILEWIILLLVLYNIAAKRKNLWVYATADRFVKKDLLQWLQQNNKMFVDTGTILDYKDELMVKKSDKSSTEGSQ